MDLLNKLKMSIQINIFIRDMISDLIFVHIFDFPNFDWDKNATIFVVDNNSPMHTDNKKKYISFFFQ